jgi:hypothetical protein
LFSPHPEQNSLNMRRTQEIQYTFAISLAVFESIR